MLTPDAQQQYHQRNQVLQELGFSSYKVYLLSALWKSIRREILLPHTRCRACGKKASHVHHARYHLEDLNGKCLENLIPVCGTCHRKAEFTKKGIKVSPGQATRAIEQWGTEREKYEGKKAAWAYLFATIEEVRIYIGADPTEEGRMLTYKLDEALQALGPKYERGRKHKKKRHQNSRA